MRRIDNPYEHLMCRAVRMQTGCLVLPNHEKHPHLYGTGKIHGVTKKLHRFVYETQNGSTDLNILHTCDYPPCFELSHLFAGTQRDNMLDMYSKGRGWNPAPGERVVLRGSASSNWKGGISLNKTEYLREYRRKQKSAEVTEVG